MNRFIPKQPDPYIKQDGDQELAKFGHLNILVDVFTSWASTATALTALGSSVSTALPITAAYNHFIIAGAGVTAGGTLPSLTIACQCKPCGPIPTIVVNNTTGGAITIYPYVSAAQNITETINDVSTGYSVPDATVVHFVQTSCTTWEAY